ncbi:hypothetical protein NLI96_g9526 [Meripilus lineatus]|uniref:Uncharacterized protein n=1 Tax=Meripilus lineatus TaxID=2056292 RepID=A0AAD5YCU3_9APHY|nr:hypothetical protein NLI96_g9526 [Physisporinus lineatus]
MPRKAGSMWYGSFAFSKARKKGYNVQLDPSYCVVPPGFSTSLETGAQTAWTDPRPCDHNYNSIKAVNINKLDTMLAICVCSASEDENRYDPILKPIMLYEHVKEGDPHGVQVKCTFRLEAFVVKCDKASYKEAQVIDIERMKRNGELQNAQVLAGKDGSKYTPWSIDPYKEPLTYWEFDIKNDGTLIFSRKGDTVLDNAQSRRQLDSILETLRQLQAEKEKMKALFDQMEQWGPYLFYPLPPAAPPQPPVWNFGRLEHPTVTPGISTRLARRQQKDGREGSARTGQQVSIADHVRKTVVPPSTIVA